MGRIRNSRLSIYKQDQLIEHFVFSSTARTAASLCGVNRKTAAFFFLRLREIIACELGAESEAMFDCEIEVDENYFRGRRKSKRGRGAAGKIPLFGLLKRGRRVYTKINPEASGATLIPIIKRKVIPDSILYSDSWRGYNVLDVSDLNINVLIIWNSLPTTIITSMGLRTSGTKPNAICANLMGFPRRNLGYIWRNVSGNLITVTHQPIYHN